MIRANASASGSPSPVEELTTCELREMNGIARHVAHRTDGGQGSRHASRWSGHELEGRRPPVGSGLGRIGGEPRRPDSLDGAVLVAVGSIAAHSHRPDGAPPRSRMSTPPGTGMNCPRDAVATALWNTGRFSNRSRMARE